MSKALRKAFPENPGAPRDLQDSAPEIEAFPEDPETPKDLQDADAYTDADVAPEAEEEPLDDAVMVLDDMSAEYLLQRIRSAEAEYNTMVEWWMCQIEKAQAKRDRIVGWAEQGLRRYFEMVPKKRTPTQESYPLPSGRLILKHQEPEYNREDEAAIVSWLRSSGHPEFVKTKETADWAGMKKQLKITASGGNAVTGEGEIIPGIRAMQREDRFIVTTENRKMEKSGGTEPWQ